MVNDEKVPYNPRRYKDFAFAHFYTEKDAQKVLQDRNEMFIQNVLVMVEPAKAPRP